MRGDGIDMEDMYTRTRALIGDGVDRLRESKVAVFGCGGVGSYVIEALARAGVGSITVVDGDAVSVTNLNRQLIATVDTVGKPKAEVQRERILSINPECSVTALDLFYLAVKCRDAGVKLISSMGTGNKIDPSRFEIADISKTSVCPLARVMRRELRARGIYHLKVLYSKEEPRNPPVAEENGHGKRVPASISFVPGAAGLMIAGEIIRDLANINI